MSALAKVRKITRGPKPVRRLRSLGLQPDLAVEPPTTAGAFLGYPRAFELALLLLGGCD